MKKTSKNKPSYGILTIIIIILLYIGNVYVNDGDWVGGFNISDILNILDTPSNNSGLSVHFIDVGQGDCALIIGEDFTMLIDAGTSSSNKKISSYLKSQNVSSIDYLIGTHPHEDHIGSLDDVILNFDVKKVYLPDAQANTKTYLNLLNAIKEKGLKIDIAKADSVILAKNGVQIKILAPADQKYDDLNNYSIVIKLVYGQTSFLFTGDAEELSELQMVEKYQTGLQADVLKVGHHGSNSSTVDAFLKAVSPTYAVISVGNNNSYNHPHKEVMQRLQSFSPPIKIYQTAIEQDIVIASDGKSLTRVQN